MRCERCNELISPKELYDRNYIGELCYRNISQCIICNDCMNETGSNLLNPMATQ